ncbi:DUF4041 domain-containing protein [Photobacterium kagoshimensis]|uniref:DUF4041 domain-containing protein n=1 Tax=Photobacterium kagoshimensis TaxID=2910242 RepID=UPI003D11344F
MPESIEPFQTLWLALSFVLIFVLMTFFLALNKRKKLLAEIIRKENLLSEKPIDEILTDLQTSIDEVVLRLSDGKPIYANMKKDLSSSREQLKYIDVGLLPPTYKFDDSESLKERIADCLERQYLVIKSGKATTAYSNWKWFGSASKGAQMVASYQSLLLRAFNAEFDMIRKKMRHSSYDTALNKLSRLEQQLEKLGETANVTISYEYVRLKEEELSVWHSELLQKEGLKKEKKAQQALLREQAKQSGGDSDDLEDDIYYRKSDLVKAQKVAKQLHGASALDMEQKIADMQKEIEKLESKFERATSQAQLTRAGYIYVISNIGSFGEGVVKIGMTRRLEPMDRVSELGDASVPFKFDVHTLTFVNDAPKIEKELHRRFNDSRVNTENHRKEFFKVSPKQVEEAMLDMGIEADWYFDIEAKEYRESLLIRESLKLNTVKVSNTSSQLPLSI